MCVCVWLSVPPPGPGNWQLPEPLHWCNCCRTRREAVDTVFVAVQRVIYHCVTGEPADNRWLSSYPCAQDALLQCSFHRLLPFTERYVNDKAPKSASAQAHVMSMSFDQLFIQQDWDRTRSAYTRRAAKFVHSFECQAFVVFFVLLLSAFFVRRREGEIKRRERETERERARYTYSRKLGVFAALLDHHVTPHAIS